MKRWTANVPDVGRLLAGGNWRTWWRRAFGGFLIFALVAGVYLSFRPSGFDEEDLAGDAQATEDPGPEDEPDEEGEGEDGEAEPDGEEDDGEEPEDEEPELSEEEAEELIEAARDPEETSVQVLDAGGGTDLTNDVADSLTEMGYDVVAINPSRVDSEVTTVLFTPGNEAEAEALRARDERFSETAPNERLSEGVDLHVTVGPDWPG